MASNIVKIASKKEEKKKKMIAVISIIVATLAFIIWYFLVESPLKNSYNIPESNNINYNIEDIKPHIPSDIVDKIDNSSGSPILLYIYTTWCGVCKKQTPIINEAARKFQNTDLKVIAFAIDRNIKEDELISYLDKYENIYFEPNYLVLLDGLSELLTSRSVKYNKKIPLTVVMARDGSIISRFTGHRSSRYLNKKIIKSLRDDDS